MLADLLVYPNELLSVSSRSVELPTVDIESIVDHMLVTMYENAGVGLAAPQIGLNIRMFVYDLSSGECAKSYNVIINPEIISSSKDKESAVEGCLSLPGQKFMVKRSNNVEVRYIDVDGKTVQKHLHGFEARVFLHELDHLDGVLIRDLGTRATIRDREDKKIRT